jgi:hypothetical protein
MITIIPTLKMMTKYKHSFVNIWFYNRWLHHKYRRPGDWTIIGIHQRWAGPNEYAYYFCLLGLEMSVWFKREFIKEER